MTACPTRCRRSLEPDFAEFPNFPADRVRELSNSDLLHMLFGVAT